MSCYRYRKIKNPLDPDRKGFYDKSYISIPDCRCSKCRKQKSNDWLVRSYFEFTSKPTTAFFVTLDFDDEHLPRYNGVPCFDSRLMSNFFESLRQSTKIPSFRYMYSTDYGGYLERPHYHVVFLFDKGAVSAEDFFSVILFYWKYGQHENIQQINPSYSGNPFKCFEYVMKYTTKDLNFELRQRELNMPKRYRSLATASVGYGAQAMDPHEFNSQRLLRDGVVFHERPTITRKYILENTAVYLDIKNNGELVPFTIPRYYELKLMYDYSFDPIEKKAHLRKNTYGSELSEIRHNCHYIEVFNSFVNSQNYNITDEKFVVEFFHKVFPDSPYNGMQWHDIVNDVLLDSERFYFVCQVYDYLDFSKSDFSVMYSVPKIYSNRLTPNPLLDYKNYFVCSLGCYGRDRKFLDYYKYDLPVQALFMFNIWKKFVALNNAHFDDWFQRENMKARMKSELKRKPALYAYLRRKNFNFNKLNFKAYVPFNQTKKD